MRRTLLIAVAFLSLVLGLSAQNRVVIGQKTQTNPDARLQIVNPDEKNDAGGVLLPFVQLSSTTNPAPLTKGSTTVHTHLKGMLVYNTVTAGDVVPGVYYNDGTKWIAISTLGATDLSKYWGTTGNAGTTAGTNFLGTTDDQALIFKVNNVQSAFLPNPAARAKRNTAFGYGALLNAATAQSDANVAFGEYALRDYVSGVTANPTWGANVALGDSAMVRVKKGGYNTAVGAGALKGSETTESWNNVAVGVSALTDLTTGSINTAVGGSTLTKLTTGSGNSVLGLSAGKKVTTGSGNALIGYLAGSNLTTGNFNVAVGGVNLQFPNPSGSRQLNIADLITGTGAAWGSFADSSTEQEKIPKVGIAQPSNVISETFDVNGTTRLRQLPANGATSAVYTKADGTTSATKDQTFTATRTVVADKNGVLGTVPGVPSNTSPGVTPVYSKHKLVIFNSKLYGGSANAERERVVRESTVSLGCIKIYARPAMTFGNRYDYELFMELNPDNGDGRPTIREPELRLAGHIFRALIPASEVRERKTMAPGDVRKVRNIDFNSEEVLVLTLVLTHNGQMFRITATGQADSHLGDEQARVFIGLERVF